MSPEVPPELSASANFGYRARALETGLRDLRGGAFRDDEDNPREDHQHADKL